MSLFWQAVRYPDAVLCFRRIFIRVDKCRKVLFVHYPPFSPLEKSRFFAFPIKKTAKKFGSWEKSITFALAFENKVKFF